MCVYMYECVIVLLCLVVYIVGDGLIGEGRWMVENVSECPDPENYPYGFTLKKKKVNRTHDVFDVEMELPEDIAADNCGLYLEACKKVDGGCKLVHVFEEDSFCDFIMKYAKKNVEKALRSANLEPNCPIPKGHHMVENFMFDPTELPDEGMLGKFQATLYLIKESKRIVCFMVDVYFEQDFF